MVKLADLPVRTVRLLGTSGTPGRPGPAPAGVDPEQRAAMSSDELERARRRRDYKAHAEQRRADARARYHAAHPEIRRRGKYRRTP